MHRGGQAENWKELLSRPRGQLMVALGQVWPLRPGCSFHCRQRNGHRAETGLLAHSTLGLAAPRAVAIPDHQGSAPPRRAGNSVTRTSPSCDIGSRLGEGVSSW